MPKNRKNPAIRISNPLPGQPPYTSLRRANLYVAEGKALWDEGHITFIRNKAHNRVVSSNRTQDQIGYDETVNHVPPYINMAHRRVQRSANRIRCIIKASISL